MSRCFDSSHLSYSRDRVWDECQYKAHVYDTGSVISVVNQKMFIGSVVDAYVSAALSGSSITEEDAWNNTMREMESKYKVNLVDWAAAMETAHAFIQVAEKEIIPVLAPEVTSVQPEWHFEINGEQYHAHPDFVTRGNAILDLKTTYKSFDPQRVNTDVQLTAYAYAYTTQFGTLPNQVGIVGLVSSKRNGVTQESFIGYRSQAQVDAWLADAETRIAGRRWSNESGQYLRQGRASLFACNGCAVQPTCPSWAGTNLAIDSTLGE
jgi:hypothetical protein